MKWLQICFALIQMGKRFFVCYFLLLYYAITISEPIAQEYLAGINTENLHMILLN